MKKILLSLSLVLTGFAAYSQVVVAGISPASVIGNYDYGVQFNCGSWPDYVGADDGTWGTFGAGVDFNQPGYYIQDTLMLVEDGTPGTNAQGDPYSQEGCNPLTNDLTGKIAVIFRGSCAFTQKAWNAQQAGAIAVLCISNVEDVNFAMSSGGAGTDGPNVTIPMVIVPLSVGHQLVNTMATNDVVMFIGNKAGAFGNDVGSVKGDFLISPYGGAHNAQFEGFDVGIQLYNYGTNSANMTVTATVDGPTGNVYTEVVGPVAMASGDTAFIFPGNTLEFPPFFLGGPGNYPDGDYTLTYSIDGGFTDDAPFDNVYSVDFRVQGDVISRAQLDGTNMPTADFYPSNSPGGEYRSCMLLHELNASTLGGTTGMYFYAEADTAGGFDYAGSEINGYAYEWVDTSLLDDSNLVPLTFGSYYPSSLSESATLQYMAFDNPINLEDDKFYLFCLSTNDNENVAFGYNSSTDNGANVAIFGEAFGPILIDGATWYEGAWSGGASPSIALNIVTDLGLEEEAMIAGSAYPNPAVDVVTVSVEAEGKATVTITDISGKTAATEAVTFVNGEAQVNTSALESGVYVFTVALENGQTSQFNVVKK